MSHSFGGSYEFNYEYDQNGNITRISDDSGNLRNEYTYDELGRLTSEINIPKGSQSSKAVVGEKIEYLYSKDGNIYQRNFYKVQALQGKTYVDAKANRSDSFGYSNTEWSDQLSSARINGKGFNFTYDKIGNPLSYRDSMVMTWQNGRQLKSIKVDDTTTLEFTYDINGQRQSKVEKKNGAAVHTTKYYYDGTKLVGENKDGTIVWYDYDESGTPVGMRLNGDDYVFRRNLQGDITGIFDSTGTLVVEYTYGNAWGFGITVSGSKAAEIGACNSLRYRGYYYDSESGLYYLNTRYYDPSICRFVNADGYVSTGPNSADLNMYAYCDNNPVNKFDPTGNDCICLHKRVRNHNCAQYKASHPPTMLDHMKNPDGSYSLYNSERNNSKRVFQEKAVTFSSSSPSYSPQKGEISAGSVDFMLISGAWQTENAKFALLDMGNVELSAGFNSEGGGVSAMASVWAPSTSFIVWDKSISLSFKVGSFGLEAKATETEGFSFGVAAGFGFSFSIK